MQLIMDVVAANDILFRVVLETAPSDDRKPLVTFYDRRHDFTEHGQKVCDYYLSSLLEIPRFSGLNLHGGVDDWSIDGDTFSIIYKWLNSFEIPVD